jgi:hypothetical protein
MANAKPKKRAMRSRRSGVKKLELVKANLSILSKLTALFIITLFATCTPVRYVYVDPKDSTIHKQRVIYNDIYLSTPLYFDYYRPYYIPVPKIVVPVHPNTYYLQNGRSGRRY